MSRNLYQQDNEEMGAFLKRLDDHVKEINDGLWWAAAGSAIDEVALLATRSNTVQTYLAEFLAGGHGTAFNYAHDEVSTYPIESRYSVDYLFLQPGDYSWRLEFMRRIDGVSPLHAPIEVAHERALRPIAVHASFKCASPEEYARTFQSFEENEALALAQSCKSTYGAFSYWRMEKEGTPTCEFPLYIKPRVNLRDSGGQFPKVKQ